MQRKRDRRVGDGEKEEKADEAVGGESRSGWEEASRGTPRRGTSSLLSLLPPFITDPPLVP